MADKAHPTNFGDVGTTVRHSLDGSWTQAELGESLDVATLSVIGELDPTGANGVVREVLSLFADTLEPELERLEVYVTSAGTNSEIVFEAHRLKSAAAQLGALRLAAACGRVVQCVGQLPESAELKYEALIAVEALIAEIIRVQRRLRELLA